MDLRIENLSINFKGCRAINNLDLNIKSGELISLLGPSGCGKSTTIFTLAGIYKPNKGNVYFGNNIVNDIVPEKRNIGMVFQNYSLYPHMSVFENIAFPLKISKASKSDIKEKVAMISKLVDIDGLLKRKPSQLSGGQQQRVAIARALVKEPQILLLDEPLSNLDARLRVKMREEIRRIQKEMKITTVFVTHDQEEAMSMSDKIAILDKGVLQQFDTPINLYNNPKNIFVAKFLGNPVINTINCKISKTEDKLKVFNKEYDLSNVLNRNNLLDAESNYILGIRSENFKVSKTSKDNYIKAKVDLYENLGKEAILKLKINEEEIRVILPSNEIESSLEELFIDFNLDTAIIFDRESGENLCYVK